MDTEVLGQILNMVAQAGEGAFTLAIIYLLVPYFKSLIFVATISVLSYTAYKLVNAFTFARKVADILGVNVGGDVYDSDRRKMLATITKLQAKVGNNE